MARRQARNSTRRRGQRSRSRPTVGVLIGWQVYGGALHSFLASALDGVRSASRDRGCSLLLACGVSYVIEVDAALPIRPAWPVLSAEADFVPVGPWNTDGLVVVTPLLSESRSRDVQQFIAAGLPVVFVGAGEEGSAVVPDNEGGIRQALIHLMEHGHRSIAFVAGYETGPPGDSTYRLAAYRSAVHEYGLESDPRLIAYGLHNRTGGYRAMRQILQSGVGFTAVLASNDESAGGVVEALTDAGLHVPGDVAVVGFDDCFNAAVEDPPLTTVRYPAFTIGYRALLLLLGHIEGQREKAEVIKVATRLIVRQSCGCPPGTVQRNLHLDTAAPDLDRGEDIKAQLAQAMAEVLLDGVRRLGPDDVRAMCQRLVCAFASGMEKGEANGFYLALQETLRRVERVNDDPHPWRAAVAVLDEGIHLLAAGRHEDKRQQGRDMLQQARTIIGESVQRHHKQYVVRQNWVASQVGQLTARLLAAPDEERIFGTLTVFLPEIGIRRAYVAFFEPEGEDPVAWSVLRVVSDAEGAAMRFPSRQFPPKELHAGDELFSLALLPLVVQERLTGFVAFDTDMLGPCAAVVRQLALAYERRQAKEELIKERNLLRTLIDNLPDSVFVKDTTGRVVIDNVAHRRFVGAETFDEVVGKTDWDFFPAELAEQYHADEQEVIQLGRPLVNWEEPSVDRDGNERWFLTSKVPLRDHKGEIVGIVGVSRDVTERKQAEGALQEAHEELARRTHDLERWITHLQKATDIARDAATILDVQQLLAGVASLIPKRFGFNYAGIFLVDEAGEYAILRAVSSEGGRRMLEKEHKVRVGGGTIVGSAAAGDPTVVLKMDEEVASADIPRPRDTRSEIALPLQVRGSIIGVLDIHSSKPEAFDEGDVTILQAMADQLAVAVENARLFEKIRQRVQELTVLFDVSRALTSTPLQPREIARVIARQITDVLGVQGCSIHLLSGPGAETMWVLFEDGAFRQEDGAEVYELSKYPATANAIRTRQPLVVQVGDPDAPSAERVHMKKRGITTLAIIPLVVKGKAIGTIELSTWGETRRYTPVEIGLATTLANQAAVALENARLFRQVEEGQRYLRAVLDSVNHAIVVTDLESVVRFTNEAVEMLFGVPEGQAIGRPLAEIVGHQALSDMTKRIAGGEITGQEALQVELSDGRALVVNLAPVTGPQGNLTGYVVAMADVTALHELSQLKSRMIRVASHDLRNPLHLAGGFFKVLLDDLPPLTEHQTNLARRVVNHLDAMERLIDNLLELERVEGAQAGQPEPLDMGEIVREVLHERRLQVELKQQQLWSEVAPDLPSVRGDRQMLIQAVANLLDNAIKYTPSEGRISVRVWVEGDEILVSVQDSGLGIPPKLQSRIFDQFYRVRQPGTEHVPGTGLGLSLVQAIVQQHKGRVWVDSEGIPGKGSTFTIALPVQQPSS